MMLLPFRIPPACKHEGPSVEHAFVKAFLALKMASMGPLLGFFFGGLLAPTKNIRTKMSAKKAPEIAKLGCGCWFSLLWHGFVYWPNPNPI